MDNKDITKRYDEVKTSLKKAIKDSNSIELNGDEENAELTRVKETLNQLNSNFMDEIDKLQNASEWDRFCMSFFGETNAGKSTIIESLRIIYNEEKRREELDRQDKQYMEELGNEEKYYYDLINKITLLNESLTTRMGGILKEIAKNIGLILVGSFIGFISAYIIL